MRDILYLSTRKLDSFAEYERGRSALTLSGEAEVSVLDALKLKFAASRRDETPQERDLDRLLRRIDKIGKHLDERDPPPRWYEDGRLAAGDWLQFDDDFVFTCYRSLFTAWLSGNRGVLLVLHGASRHVWGDLALELESRFPHDRFSSSSYYGAAIQELWAFIESLHTTHGGARPKSRTNAAPRSTLPVTDAVHALAKLNEYFDQGTLAGLARVSKLVRCPDSRTDGSQLQRIVFASPLYVARA